MVVGSKSPTIGIRISYKHFSLACAAINLISLLILERIQIPTNPYAAATQRYESLSLVRAEQPRPLYVAPIVSSYEVARLEEAKLFESHSLLSKIDKSIVGIPVLAQKLVQMQPMIVSKTLPEIIKKINEKLTNNLVELDNLPAHLSSAADAMFAFMHIFELPRDSLRKIRLVGEFEEYPEDKHMHCTARLVEMLNSFAVDLQNCAESDATKDFLMEEISVLEEGKLIGLPLFGCPLSGLN